MSCMLQQVFCKRLNERRRIDAQTSFAYLAMYFAAILQLNFRHASDTPSTHRHNIREVRLELRVVNPQRRLT